MMRRPELCFWRSIAIFAVFICMANIIVLLKTRNISINEKDNPELPAQEQQRKQVSLMEPTTRSLSTTAAAQTTEEVQQKIMDMSKTMVRSPLWLDIVNVQKFFVPEKVLVLGKKRNRKDLVVMGIPTVHRSQAYYLIDTINYLVLHLSEQNRHKVIIVILVADFDPGFRNKVVFDIKDRFPDEVHEGIIQVIQSPKEFYPDLNNVPSMYGDNPERTKWRSKQCLDYSFLYYYCADLAEYYIQLEDDVLVEEGYFEKIESFLQTKQNEKWSIIEFGARGFIGMTYRTSSLLSLARFSRYFFWTMPIDWIFREFNDIFLFGRKKKDVFKPAIFKHVGKHSSLHGQVRALEDVKGMNIKLPLAHVNNPQNGNPSAIITTSIREYVSGHEIEKAYSGEDFFWGKAPKVGQYVELVLKKPMNLSRIIIPSGTKHRPYDTFLDTSLAVSYSPQVGGCAEMHDVKHFSDTEKIDYVFPKANIIYCVRLTILKPRLDIQMKPFWLIITEIRLF